MNDEKDILEFLKEKDFQKRIDTLAKKYRNKKVMVYGVGLLFEAIAKNYDLSSLNIIGVADLKFNDGDKFLDYDAFSYKTFMEQKPDIVLIGAIKSSQIQAFFTDELCKKYGKIKSEPLIKQSLKEKLSSFLENKTFKEIELFFEYYGANFLLKSRYSLNDLEKFFNNKTVAIIGNAQSIHDFKFGDAIDNHDIVIRINNGYPKIQKSQGSKTTVISSGYNKVTQEDLEENFEHKMVIWSGTKKSILYSDNYVREKVFIQPYSIWRDLKLKISNKKTVVPTSGAYIINLICNRFNPKSVDIYGFDFLKSDTINEKKATYQCSIARHDFHKESKMVLNLVENNESINIHGFDFY